MCGRECWVRTAERKDGNGELARERERENASEERSGARASKRAWIGKTERKGAKISERRAATIM